MRTLIPMRKLILKFSILCLTFLSVQVNATNYQLYLFNQTTGTYMLDDIDSIVLQSKSQRLKFIDLKKSADRNSIIFSNLPQDTYDVIVYLLYYPDKIVRGVNVNGQAFKSKINFSEAEKLTPSKASFPGGRDAFYCLIKKNANNTIIKSDNDLFDVCFSIDTLGNAKAYLYQENKSNKVTDEINRILLNAPKWTPSLLKSRSFYYSFCCANWWTDCKSCQ